MEEARAGTRTPTTVSAAEYAALAALFCLANYLKSIANGDGEVGGLAVPHRLDALPRGGHLGWRRSEAVDDDVPTLPLGDVPPVCGHVEAYGGVGAAEGEGPEPGVAALEAPAVAGVLEEPALVATRRRVHVERQPADWLRGVLADRPQREYRPGPDEEGEVVEREDTYHFRALRPKPDSTSAFID